MGLRKILIAAELAESIFKNGVGESDPAERIELFIVDARVVERSGARYIELLVRSDAWGFEAEHEAYLSPEAASAAMWADAEAWVPRFVRRKEGIPK